MYFLSFNLLHMHFLRMHLLAPLLTSGRMARFSWWKFISKLNSLHFRQDFFTAGWWNILSEYRRWNNGKSGHEDPNATRHVAKNKNHKIFPDNNLDEVIKSFPTFSSSIIHSKLWKVFLSLSVSPSPSSPWSPSILSIGTWKLRKCNGGRFPSEESNFIAIPLIEKISFQISLISL